jgi:hypothetical protein
MWSENIWMLGSLVTSSENTKQIPNTLVLVDKNNRRKELVDLVGTPGRRQSRKDQSQDILQNLLSLAKTYIEYDRQCILSMMAPESPQAWKIIPKFCSSSIARTIKFYCEELHSPFLLAVQGRKGSCKHLLPSLQAR